MPGRPDEPHARSDVDRPVVELPRIGVDSLVRQIQHEGTLPVLHDERDGTIGQDVSHVALDLVKPPILVDLRVGDPSLAREADPMVEAGTRCRIVPHVPLPDERGLVPQAL